MVRALLFASVIVGAFVPGCSCGNVRLPSDAAVVDASVPSGPDVDPRGTWRSCRSTWTFEDDGSVEEIDHVRGCASVGVWDADGFTLHVAWSATCGERVSERTFDATRSSVGLVLVDREGSLVLLAPETSPVRAYTLVDDAEPTHRSVVRLIGEPGRAGGSGCYWSEDGECGGLLSCSGNVEQWPLGDEEVVASTTCGGECPCGAILHVTPNGDGTFAVRYDTLSCGPGAEGTATALPRED